MFRHFVCRSRILLGSVRPLSGTRSLCQAEVDPKITGIVDQISTLNLIETANLVKELKTRLNIQDVPVAAAPQTVMPPSQTIGDSKEDKKAEQTQFKITLEKFDAASKAKVIKEIKALLPGANLVEAKKFVESAPKMIKEGLAKDEAEKIKKAIEAVGGTVSLS